MKKVILIVAGVIALLLFLSEPRQPVAQVSLGGGSVGITCSADGRYVYVLLGGASIAVSENYGAHWKKPVMVTQFR